MLIGFFVTLFWIPGSEHNSEGHVKSLENWEVGRESNGFAKTWLARKITPVYHRVAKIWDRFYLWLDKVTDGDLAEQRQRRQEQEMATMLDN